MQRGDDMQKNGNKHDFYTVLMGSALIDKDSKIVVADEAVYIFMGVSRSFTFSDYIHPEHRQHFTDCLAAVTDEPFTFISKCKRHDGEYIDISVTIASKLSDKGVLIKIDVYEIAYMSANYKNISIAVKTFGSFIAMSEKKFFYYDVQTGIFYLCDKNEDIFKGTLQEFHSYCIDAKKISPDYLLQFDQLIDSISEANGDGFFKLYTSFFKENYHPTVISFSAIEFYTQTAYITGFLADSATFSGVDAYTAHRINLDPLTNLLNKKAIGDYALNALSNAKESGGIVTFVMIDLDNFKSINDTYGHMFGDATIVSVARIISEAVGERGIVGRVGGDEFFIVLTGYPNGNESIRPLLKTIRSKVKWYFQTKSEDMKVTCSVGTATYPDDTDSYEKLYKLADYCLYVAKVLGRDRYIIYTRSILGSVEDILSSNTIIRMDNYVSDNEKYKHLLSVVGRCNENTNKTETLNEVLGELLEYYDLNSAAYCPRSEENECFVAADHDPDDIRIYARLYPTFKEKLDSSPNGCVSIGNYMNAVDSMPELVSHMQKNKLNSLLIIPHLTAKHDTLGFFIFAARDRFKKWSDFDINMLKVICTLINYLL